MSFPKARRVQETVVALDLNIPSQDNLPLICNKTERSNCLADAKEISIVATVEAVLSELE